MKRMAYDYQGNEVGELDLPDSTSEDVWQARLAIYSAAPPSLEAIQDKILSISIKDRKQWAEEMLERFKKRNIITGINGAQALWLHHRMRALEINFSGIPMTLDILNMAISGDVETACLAIIYSTPDDGTAPYHFFDQAAKDWLVAEMKSFLGWS